MVYDNILEAVGHTPMIRLRRMAPGGAQVLVKFEGLNVGGSIKTRTALAMIEDAERRGLIGPDTVIVEPTSGNQGVGLALCGAVKGYRVRVIMPDSVSQERRKLVRQYGAQVVLVHDEGDIGACIAACRRMADEMAREDPRVFVPSQFDNPANPEAHRRSTAREILEQAGDVDGFCAGFGTGGTLTGIGEVLRAHNPRVAIWAAEPENAAVLSGGRVGSHVQMGIGDGLVPGNLNTALVDRVCIVSDAQALQTARDLARLEGLMCGISSGTNVAAALEMARALGPGRRVVTVLPDTAERYFSTPLFDA